MFPELPLVLTHAVRVMALTPCAALPVLLPHRQQLLHAIIHGLGELPHGITLLFSGSRDSCQSHQQCQRNTEQTQAPGHGFGPKYQHKRDSRFVGHSMEAVALCHFVSSDSTEDNQHDADNGTDLGEVLNLLRQAGCRWTPSNCKPYSAIHSSLKM